jgi:hypothetical protein
MVKLSMLSIAVMVFLALFFLSLAEISVFGFIGAFTSFQYVIGVQMIISVLLFFIAIVLSIFSDITKP